MRRLLLLLLIVGLLALPLALALRDLSRVLIGELMRLAWILRQQAQSIPQVAIWGLLLVGVVVAALGSLLGWSHVPLRRETPPVHGSGQVRELSLWIRRAAEGRYFRWTLNRYVSNLIWEVLAHAERTTPRRLRQRFRSGDLALPPAMADYLEGSSGLRPSVPAGLWPPLLRRRDARAGPDRLAGEEAGHRPSVEEIIAYLEEQLEGRDDPGTG